MAIGRKVVGPTALSSTTSVLIGGAALTLPDAAKCILGIKIMLTSPAGNTAGEPIVAKVWLESDDFHVTPFQVLAQPIGSTLLKSISQPQGENIEYPVNVKETPNKAIGGSRLKVYAAGLFDHTIEPYVAVEVSFCDYIPRDPITKRVLPQYFSQVGTFTDTGTSAGEAVGSGITIVGAKRIKEVFGFAVGTTVAALKGICGKFRLNSSGIVDFGDIEFLINPASGQVDTDIVETIAGVARSKVDVRVKNKLTITDYFNLGVGVTTTGDFICGVLYI